MKFLVLRNLKKWGGYTKEFVANSLKTGSAHSFATADFQMALLGAPRSVSATWRS